MHTQVPPAYVFKCRAKKLDRKDTFGLSDPFLVIKCRGIVVFKTEVKKTTLSPNWNPFKLEPRDFVNEDQLLRFEVHDWDKDGNHDFIGSMESNIASLSRSTGQEIQLTGQSSSGKSKRSGKIIFESLDPSPASPVPLAYRIKFSAKGLSRKDKLGLGKSDPFLEVFAYPRGGDNAILINRTTYIENDLNPVWEEIVLQVHSCGGMDSKLTIKVTDHDNDGTHDFIGLFTTSLRELTFPQQLWVLTDHKKHGNIFYRNSGTLTAEAHPHNPDYSDSAIHSFRMQCFGKKLERKDMMGLGKSDPYFIIKREIDNMEVYRSEIIKSKLNPEWDRFTISVEACQGLDSPLIIEVWDWDKITKDDFIGKFKTTLRALSLFEKDPNFPLINPSKAKNITYRTSGFFRIIEMIPSYHQQPQHAHTGPQRAGSLAAMNPYGSQMPGLGSTAMPSQTALFPSTNETHDSSALPLFPSTEDPYATAQSSPILNYDNTNSYSNNTNVNGYQNNAPPPNYNTNTQPAPMSSYSNAQQPTNAYQSNAPPNYTTNQQTNAPGNYQGNNFSTPAGNINTSNTNYNQGVSHNNTMYSSAAQSQSANLPSYITGLSQAPPQTPIYSAQQQHANFQPNANVQQPHANVHGSSVYADGNLPAYLSNVGTSNYSPPQSTPPNQQSTTNRPYGYI